MYAIKGELDASGIYLDEEVERFSAVHFKPRRRQSARDHQAMNDQTEDARIPGRLTEERVRLSGMHGIGERSTRRPAPRIAWSALLPLHRQPTVSVPRLRELPPKDP